MAEDAGAAGFEVASAYVSVSPNTDTFAEQLEGELGALDYVVTVPVVADTAGLAEDVQAQADAAKTEIAVPVVPDTEGFQSLLDEGTRDTGAEVTVPVIPDTAGFASGIEEAAAAAGDAAAEEVAAAGTAAGAGFSERFAAAAEGASLFPAAGLEGDAAAAGEESATGFGERFASMLAGVPLLGGLMGGAEAEGAEAGTAAGEGFMGNLKGIISGDMPVMETLLGAGFVAATAVMASKFQAAMELIHTQAGVAQSAISGLSGQVLSLAGQVGETPDSLAQALYHVESSFQSVGISGSKALQLVQIAAEGARTGNADLVDVTNALDAAIVSGVGGIHNYSQAMGALNAIVGSGDMTMQNLADAMGTGLMAAGKAYGQSIEQIGAALATFGDNNIRGAKAATDLRMAWQAVEAPLKTGIPVLNGLGLSANQLANEMTEHGLTGALQMFVDHLQASHVPIDQWGQIVTEVFGKRAGVGIQVLIDQLSRMQGKLPDIEKGAQDFGNAWASTEATTSQKLHDLEAGFDALMIRIGDGLLPAVNSFMGMIDRNLPAIEHFGTEIAHLIAPAVSVFFDGLAAILKVLFGPLRDITFAVGAFAAAWIALDAVMAINPFVAIGIALITLVGLIVKYHKQIFDTITSTWDSIAHFFAGIIDPIVQPIEKAFDEVKAVITGGFDKWWASHGAEVEKVWDDTWNTIKTVFSAVWDYLVTLTTAEWDAIMAVIKPGLDLLLAVFKTAWASIQETVQTAWDVIAAAVKIAVAGIESVIKIAWDLIEGIFTVALDLITGQWGKAWTDLQNTATQIWNTIKTYFQTVWNAIYNLTVQIINNLISYFTRSWAAIKSGVVSAFDDIKSTVLGIWDDILSGIETVVSKIKSVISDIPGGGLVSSALGAVGIHLAGGGVVPGYAPGRDSVHAMLSPGEAILVPEAVRAIGPARIHAINAHYSRHRGGSMAFGGIIPGYAGGGVVTPSAIPQAIATGILQVLSQVAGTAAPSGTLGTLTGGGAGMPQPSGSGVSTMSGGNTFNLYFTGTQWPTAEQQQAMMHQLSAAVGVS